MFNTAERYETIMKLLWNYLEYRILGIKGGLEISFISLTKTIFGLYPASDINFNNIVFFDVSHYIIRLPNIYDDILCN